MKAFAACLVLLLSVAGLCAAEPPVKPWLEPLLEKLTQKISLELDETPLDEALTALRTLATVPIIVDPAAYSDSGPEVNVNLKNSPLSDVLKKMLEPNDLQY